MDEFLGTEGGDNDSKTDFQFSIFFSCQKQQPIIILMEDKRQHSKFDDVSLMKLIK